LRLCDFALKSDSMLETARLFLRPMNDGDIDAVFAMRADADVMRFIREPQKRPEAEKWVKLISSKWESHKIGLCAVILKETNELVGWCGLWILTETGEIEVGYAIASKHWKKGFASEAAEICLKYGFDELKLDKIVACANPKNEGSQAVMRKIGMTFDHIGYYYGTDLVHYTITKDEFANSL
jgi:RimJ/RimL family protein N-acetyltransferase